MEKLLQDLESQVSCSICFEFLQTPKILPCFPRILFYSVWTGWLPITLVGENSNVQPVEPPHSYHNPRELSIRVPAVSCTTVCWICWPSRKLGTLQRCVENCGKTASDCSFCFECGTMFCSEPTLSIKSKRLKTSRSRTTRIIFKGRRFAVKSFTKTNRLCYTVKLANFPCANCAGLSTRKTHSTHEIIIIIITKRDLYSAFYHKSSKALNNARLK